MRGLTAAAIGSLIGVVASIVLYSYYPLPSTDLAWQDPALWVSVLLLVVGLVCFVILLISGLITLLNWHADAERAHKKGR